MKRIQILAVGVFAVLGSNAGAQDPLLDLTEEIRTLFATFKQSVLAANTNVEGAGLVEQFGASVDAVLKKPEFATVALDFNQKTLVPLIAQFKAALAIKEEAKPGFGNSRIRWTESKKTKTSVTYNVDGNPAFPLTFHILEGKESAMASIETPFKLVKATGIQLEQPGAVGPFAYRAAGRDMALWNAAVHWRAAYKLKIRPGSVKTFEQIFPHIAVPDDCPLTWVSGRKAVAIAQALGGRLPTLDEWNFARGRFKQDGVKLAGKLLKDAENEINSLSNSESLTEFSPMPDPIRYKPGAIAVLPINERGVLWLATVRDNQTNVADLIGNASEWVTDGGRLCVVGGSFATKQNVDYTTPVYADPNRGYYDVSFRLVLDIVHGSEAAGLDALKRAVNESKFAP